MAYFEAPSFSLGLDLGFDSDPQFPLPDFTAQKPASGSISKEREDDDGGEMGTGFTDCVTEIGNDPPRKLKRLKRGSSCGSSLPEKKESPPLFSVLDDDIEEFSSQDDFSRDSHPSSHFQSVCSSSKAPLHGILTATTSSQLKGKEKKRGLDPPNSVDLEKQKKSMFSDLTISPLRKFQLLESDSDDPSGCDNRSVKRYDTNSSINKQKPITDHSATMCEDKKRFTTGITQKEDLWEGFCQPKSFHLPTPAFDEICEEFVQLRKENKPGTNLESNKHTSCKDHANNTGFFNELWDKPNCPAHYYFLHDDPRIQKLVRDRLPNFSPLGVDGSLGSVIDYMRQFSNGEASTCHAPLQINKGKSSKNLTDISKGTKNRASKGGVNVKPVPPLSSKKAPKRAAPRKNKFDKSSRNVQSKMKGLNSEELLKDSGSWIDPRSSSSLPIDAGKRRVHASDQSTGHWYTSPEGRKVYVNKSGEELTGRNAYKCYKKDNGGFRKSKKKGGGKKRK